MSEVVRKEVYITMATKKGLQGCIDVEDADGGLTKPITYVILVDSNLPSLDRLRIRSIDSDWTNFQLGLCLTCVAYIHIIHNPLPVDNPTQRHLCAW